MGIRKLQQPVFAFALSLLSAAVIAAGSAQLSFAQTQTQTQTREERLAQELRLQAELEQVLRDIAAQRAVLQSQRNQSASIRRDINILNGQIREAQLKLTANSIRIQQLAEEIRSKTNTIEELEERVTQGKSSLARLISEVRKINDYSGAEIFLSNQNLSDFFREAESLRALKAGVNADIERVLAYQRKLAEERASLEMVRNQQEVIRSRIAAEKRQIEASQNQKEVLLSASRQQERAYERIVADREARAAQIRSALFSLRDVPDINFGQALDLARDAERRTGIRPAFLLAVITQESNLGRNVGSCIVTDLTSGATRHVNSGRVFSNGIHRTRDLPVLQRILPELGRNPLDTRVSCPIGSMGFGGAMGPAQFIPSTWILYADRVAGVTGERPANPWSPRDAFIASSLFLADLGASSRTHAAEWQAAARYYAGAGWRTRGVGYANSVMAIAARIQGQIEALEAL
jgi:membrane-bound lytic murein transglycosylase B